MCRCSFCAKRMALGDGQKWPKILAKFFGVIGQNPFIFGPFFWPRAKVANPSPRGGVGVDWVLKSDGLLFRKQSVSSLWLWQLPACPTCYLLHPIRATEVYTLNFLGRKTDEVQSSLRGLKELCLGNMGVKSSPSV